METLLVVDAPVLGRDSLRADRAGMREPIEDRLDAALLRAVASSTWPTA